VLYGITFASDSAVITPESAATLEEVRAALAAELELRVEVAGHTDSTNTDAYNLDLSARRARKVVDLLVQRGADPSRVQSQGFGRTRPVADNATAQGRALNRRVEVSVAK
jgi:outer membrane protein OmpA-like peptidoglycan-associated protein